MDLRPRRASAQPCRVDLKGKVNIMLKSTARMGMICTILTIILPIWVGRAHGDLTEEIDAFDIDHGTLESVQAAFGMPWKGCWGNRSVSVAEGPQTRDYLLHYADRFVVRIFATVNT